MGVVILTKDDSPYRGDDDVVMHGEMTYPPTAPGVTYILHIKAFSEKDIIRWAPLVPYRLVVVVDNVPRLTEASEGMVIEDRSLKGGPTGFKRPIEAVFKWADRRRAHRAAMSVPLPLLGSFLGVNRVDDISTARRLSQCKFMLPDEYAHAVIGYSIRESTGQIEWPKKKKAEEELSVFFRTSDEYATDIIGMDDTVSNEVRDKTPDNLPSSLPKRKQGVTEWL